MIGGPFVWLSSKFFCTPTEFRVSLARRLNRYRTGAWNVGVVTRSQLSGKVYYLRLLEWLIGSGVNLAGILGRRRADPEGLVGARSEMWRQGTQTPSKRGGVWGLPRFFHLKWHFSAFWAVFLSVSSPEKRFPPEMVIWWTLKMYFWEVVLHYNASDPVLEILKHDKIRRTICINTPLQILWTRPCPLSTSLPRPGLKIIQTSHRKPVWQKTEADGITCLLLQSHIDRRWIRTTEESREFAKSVVATRNQQKSTPKLLSYLVTLTFDHSVE